MFVEIIMKDSELVQTEVGNGTLKTLGERIKNHLGDLVLFGNSGNQVLVNRQNILTIKKV